MTRLKSILFGVALGLAMGAFFVGAWWLGGKDVCAGYMARYDLLAGACYGGKLHDKTYTPSVEEQIGAALGESVGWLIVLTLPLVAIPLARFIRVARGAAVKTRSNSET